MIRLEKKLCYKYEGSDAYLVRQALDLLYPDWREVTEYKEIKDKVNTNRCPYLKDCLFSCFSTMLEFCLSEKFEECPKYQEYILEKGGVKKR